MTNLKMQSLQCPFSLPRSALWGWYFVMRIGGNKFMLKKNTSWAKLETLEHDRRQICDMHGLYVFGFAVTKILIESKQQGFCGVRTQLFRTNPTLVCQSYCQKLSSCLSMILTAGMRWLNSLFFCVVMQCVSTQRDFCIHSYRNF